MSSATKMLYRIYSLILTCLAGLIGLSFAIFGILGKSIGAYTEVSLIISKIPFALGEKSRYIYYGITLLNLGKDVVFKYGSFCQYPNISIGNRVLIGYYNTLGEVNIGDDVLIGGYVNFISGRKQHSFNDSGQLIRTQESKGRSPISIGSDVWIGSNCVVMANIANRCVLGAGSVLVTDAEGCSVYAGNPARLIRKLLPKS